MPPPPSLPARTAMVSSSPSRAEKLPTPGFARLLHRNGGSRSRGRSSLSRSSPLFPSRTRNLSRAAGPLDAGEPSSPKVTCIGQVRIRKKKNKTTTASSFIASNPKRNRPQCEKRQEGEMRCRCLDKSLLCSVFHRRRKSSADAAGLRPIWRRWLMGLRFAGNEGYRRRKEPILEAEEAAPAPPSRALGENGSGIAFVESERDDVEKGECNRSRVFVPPKNALILMRCRSAPHNRSSVLATAGDYGSRINGEREEEDGNGAASIGIGSGDGEEGNEEEEEEEEEKRCPSSRPLFLKRCKSEPAKKAARLAVVEAAICSQNGGGSGNRRLAVDEVPSPVH